MRETSQNLNYYRTNTMLKIKHIDLGKIKAPSAVIARLGWVQDLSKQFGWDILNYHPNNYVVNLQRGEDKINVYLSTGTVQTVTHHPKKGKTQLNRKNVSEYELRQIMQSVRVHTGKGYYTKNK